MLTEHNDISENATPKVLKRIPLYAHNCSECKYLGAISSHFGYLHDTDLYYCGNHASGIPAIVVRKGPDVTNVSESMFMTSLRGEYAIGFVRAVMLGYIKDLDEVRPYMHMTWAEER